MVVCPEVVQERRICCRVFSFMADMAVSVLILIEDV